MNHLVSIPRHQAVVNLTLRRLLVNAANSPPNCYPSRLHSLAPSIDTKNSDRDCQTISRSEANGVWKSFQIINSTFSQLHNGNKAALVCKHTAQDNGKLPNQAILCFKDETPDSNENESFSREFKKICSGNPFPCPNITLEERLCFQFPDPNRYVANWNTLLNNTYEGLFVSNTRVFSHLKHPLAPLPPCSRELHTFSKPLCQKAAPLPPYEPPRDSLGLTYISDLNDEDAERIKHVAYEELKALLTKNEIGFSKNKAKKRTADSGVFGTALEVLVEKDIKKNKLISDLKVPAVFLTMVRYIEENGLDTEGLFRVSGSADRVKSFRKELESNFYKSPKYQIPESGDLSIHDVTSTFKAFLRELPASLVSSERMEYFPNIWSMPYKDQLTAANMFILSMKEEYRDTLQVFLRLVNTIAQKKSVTKMDEANLATCLTPNIFALPKLKTPELEMKHLNEQFGYFRMMAVYNKKLFAVPPNFISQIRQQYVTGVSAKPKRKFISKLLGKKKKGGEEVAPPREELMKLTETEIEVHAPHMTKESAVIKINSSTTAKDVLYMYGGIPKDLFHDLRKKLDEKGILNEDRPVDYLCEVGGNIGERCLDPDTKMLDLYRVNPTAEWMIKTKKGR